MSTTTRRFYRRGQALTEFAFLAPVLVLILGTVLDFGLALYTDLNLNKIAQDAAFTAAHNALTDAGAQSLVATMASDYGLAPGAVTTTVSHPVVGGTSALQLDLSLSYRPISPGVLTAANGGITLNAFAVYVTGP